jgi:outer membrane protein assembly factor BamB
MVGLAVAGVGLSAWPTLWAADWTHYRGPNHDGVSTETIRTNWSEDPPRRLWRVALEPGLSSLSISDGRVFTQVRRNLGSESQEWCVALDANSGRELWATPLGIADYPDGGVGWDDGPRSTPVVDGDRVFVFTSYLRLVCLAAASGSIVWSRDIRAEYNATVIAWQNAASPVIVGDRVLVNGNASNQRLMAFRKEDGALLWKGQNDRMTQATPVAATVAGVPQVIFFTQTGLVSVAPETGNVLWRFSFPYSTSTAASPVVAGDLVYCSAAYGSGSGAVRINASGAGLSATDLWKLRGANMNHWATPVHHEGYLYGIYGQSLVSLRCIELATGNEKWRADGVGTGGLLMVSGLLLVLTEEGRLLLVRPDPAAYREVARLTAVAGKCWNVPAISGGRIYARSTTEAACWEVAPKALPPVRLQADSFVDGAGFHFSLLGEDGAPFDATRAARVQVYATEDVKAPLANWTLLPERPILTNGQWRVSDPAVRTTPQRFFRVQEQP